MLRLYVLLSFICLLIFEVVSVEAQEQEVISSSKSKMPPTEDMICVSVLEAEMTLSKALKKMGLEDVEDGNLVSTFTIFWNEVPVVRGMLQDFVREIHYVQNQSHEDNYYRKELISSIWEFIQSLSKKVLGGIDKSLSPSEDEVHVLTYHVRQLEEIIHRLGTLSPVESLIYADIINSATEYLSNLGNVREFNFERYIAEEYKGFGDLNISNADISDVLKSAEQRRYLLQQYQLLQRYPNRFTGTTVQNNNSVMTEQEMREEGYSEDVIRGFDHAKDSLHLARSLRARNIDPVATHIPEFADLIDEHIDYIRKGVSESQRLSSSEKANRLDLLDVLEAKAQAYKDSEQITYFYCLMLNLRLSMIATPDSDLLSDEDLHSFMLKRDGDSVNFESFRQWVINDDGSDILKIADLFELVNKITSYEYNNERRDNDKPENEEAINNIVQKLGLDLTLNDLRDLYLRSYLLFMQELARRLNLNLHDFDVEDIEGFTNFIHLFNHFPERIMIPTIHDLGFMAITRTHNRGVHLLGLNNDFSRIMPPFGFILHDTEHSWVENLSSPQFVDYFESQLEYLPRTFRELMEELYLDFTHEEKNELTVLLTIKDLDLPEVSTIERYQQEYLQKLFQFTNKLGHLTEAEELELQKTILILNYLELASNYRILERYEDIEFTETSLRLVNVPTFMRFIVSLYGLYEQEQRLLITLDSIN